MIILKKATGRGMSFADIERVREEHDTTGRNKVVRVSTTMARRIKEAPEFAHIRARIA